jgi:cytochrome c oxidase subunit 3
MQKHPFHLVDVSNAPILGAFGAFCATAGGVAYFQGYNDGGITMVFGQIILLYTMFVWFRDIIREATYEGHHTKQVQQTHTIGMILFIVSEIMFFVSFFWAFFHSSLAPTIDIGAVYPPVGITILDAWHIPFLNTIILLTSGATVTWTHHAILSGARKQAIISLVATVILGGIFTLFQVKEYLEAPFAMSDGVYGSTFYLATGFHGMHIAVGSIFLVVCLVRIIQFHFNKFHHFGFEAAAYYWHFVDVVWLFLFACIYWWGGN